MSFSHNLAVYRKRSGMSQEELAEHIHVSRQTISKWETGQSAPDPDTVLQLALLFGITTDRLLTEIPDPPQPEVSPASAEIPQTVKAPLPDTHVFGRYVFGAVLFLGGVLLLFMQLLCARWGLWLADWFDLFISLLIVVLLTVPPLVVVVQYIVSKCRTIRLCRRNKDGKGKNG